MGLIIKASGEILDYSGSFAFTSSRFSIFDIGSRKYDVVKGLKFPKNSDVNKKVFDSRKTAPMAIIQPVGLEEKNGVDKRGPLVLYNILGGVFP